MHFSRMGVLLGLTVALGAPAGAQAASAPSAVGRAYLESRAAQFGLGHGSALRATRTSRVAGGVTAVRYQQSIDGVDVLGGEFVVRLDSGNRVRTALGEAVSSRPSVTPAIAADEAERQAIGRVARDAQVHLARLRATGTALRIFEDQVLGGPSSAPAALVWATTVTDGLAIRRLVLVDAEHGFVRAVIERNPEAKTRSVCDAANQDAQVPCVNPLLTEGGTYNGPVADVQPAYDFSGDTYDFFKDRFDRDSLDGQGMALKSTVRYCDPAESCPFQNAFWNGAQMVYGQGYAGADDVVGHELSHGFTEFTSGLFYYYQSGAINESLSDVFGELVDQVVNPADDLPAEKWKLAEDLGLNLRDMADPPSLGDPDTMTSVNFVTGAGDNGGVHTNSGVNNKAAFLMTDGTGGALFGGQSITGIGLEKVARLYYDVETGFLVSGSDYHDLGLALGQACDDRVAAGSAGFTATDCVQVRKAVVATGMLVDRPETPDDADCPTGEVAVYNFDNGFDASVGWTVSDAPVGWFLDDSYATGGVLAAHGLDFDYAADHSVISPAISVPTGGFLRFRHAYDFDRFNGTFYDGGVVEVSANGSAFADALPAGEYTATIPSGDGNPLAGRAAFGGVSNGYRTVVVPIGALAGSSVRVRFRIGTGDFGGGYGWFVDDVAVGRCVKPAAPEVVTSPASVFSSSSATLVGSVNPHFGKTTYHFEWGAGTSLDSVTPDVVLEGAEGTVPVSHVVQGLTPGTTYSYRIVAVNVMGRSEGVVRTVTTDSTVPTQAGGGTTTPGGATGGGTTGQTTLAAFPAKVAGTAKAVKKGGKPAKVACTNPSATFASCKVVFAGAKRKRGVSAKLTLAGKVVAKGAVKKADGKGTIQIVGKKPLKRGSYVLVVKVGSRAYRFTVRLA
jgi:Zn-dependent metalloprotease